MHELSITRTLIDMILREAKIPEKVIIELGALSTYKKDPVEYYFDILKQDYKILVNTQLEVIEQPGKMKCDDCKNEWQITDFTEMICTKCKSANTTILMGKEIILKEIIEGEKCVKNADAGSKNTTGS